MACACPCFGDEADAEEKPNQMIQLDGLGMLRLDTQHVGQGSQGARSAKWFYFGETDDRLAVVNMLLCITCFLMWILAIWAVSTYYPEANPSEQSNNGGRQEGHGAPVPQEGAESILPININANAPPHAMAGNVALKKLKKEFRQYQAKHPAHITEDSRVQLEADKNKFKNALVNIKTYIECKGDDLTKLPEMIRESKKETEKKLQEMQVNVETIRKSKEVTKKKLQEMQDLMNEKEKDALEWKILAERWRPYAEAHFANGFETSYRINPNVEDDVYSKKTPVLYNEFREKKRLEEPKDGDDPNGNNEFVVNNTNGDDNKNVLETNDDNQ
eukprot:352276_1